MSASYVASWLIRKQARQPSNSQEALEPVTDLQPRLCGPTNQPTTAAPVDGQNVQTPKALEGARAL